MAEELKLETIDDIVKLEVNEYLKTRNIDKRIRQLDKEITARMNEKHKLLQEVHFFDEGSTPKWMPYVEARVKKAIEQLEEREERRRGKYGNNEK